MSSKNYSEKTVKLLLLGQHRAELEQMWNEGVSTREMYKYFKCSHESVLEALHRLYGSDAVKERKRKTLARKSKCYAETHGANRTYKKPLEKKWYSVVPKPSWWTGKTKGDYIYLHQFVYCTVNFLTEIPKGYCVHHIDLDKQNNASSNLALMTHADHMKLHSSIRRGGVTTIPKGSTCKCMEAPSIPRG